MQLILFACNETKAALKNYIATMTLRQTKLLSRLQLRSFRFNCKLFPSTMEGDKFVSVDFEVFGRVQGVFFRKYTQKQAGKLGLSGWCMNTEDGTVQGNMQGSVQKIAEMKSWLKSVGSPQSRIDKAVFSGETPLKQRPGSGFMIRH